MREGVIWTNLTPGEISQRLKDMGTSASIPVVRGLLGLHGYARRKAQKRLPTRRHKDQDAQFRNIARLRAAYEASVDPVLSIDTKKKEFIGRLFRAGKLWTLEELETLDHDFPSDAEGVAIPHGLYDLKANHGHVNLGTSRDTSRFACDSIAAWWHRHGKARYPDARSLLLLCDGGGSNSASRFVFKAGLQGLADRLGIEIRVAHYPPGCSKYNPIEHRLFPHVTRACQGVVFTSVELVKQLVEKARTRTGLEVTADILAGDYPAGEKVPAGFKESMRIVFDETLPKWNYRAIPGPDAAGRKVAPTPPGA